MGFNGLRDKIGELTRNAGVLTLQPSLLTIGGQQYRTPLMTFNLGTLLANTLYMLYAVKTGPSSFQLVTSNSFNSVGPVGYTSWKLVGAFYSNGIGTYAFGSFVTIDTTPMSKEWAADPKLGQDANGSGTSFTIGPGGNFVYNISRQGNKARCFFQAARGATGGSTGTGNPYNIPMPDNMTYEPAGQWIGQGSGYFGGTIGFAPAVAAPHETGFGMVVQAGVGTYMGQNNPSTNWWTSVANASVGFDVLVPIVGWENTPLVYL